MKILIYFLTSQSLHRICTGFCRDFRTINVSFTSDLGNQVTVNFDPIVRTFSRTSEEVCKSFRCIPDGSTSEMADFAKKLYQDRLLRYLKEEFEQQQAKLIKVDDYENNCHEMTRKHYNEVRIEVGQILQGKVYLRSSCISPEERVLKQSHCAYFSTVNTYLLDNSTIAIDWIDASEYLFNKLQYKHAIAICLFLLQQKHIYTDQAIENRAWIILAEGSRVFGDLSAATYFNAKVLAQLSSVADRGREALRRLQALLMTPPLPPSTSEAAAQRELMVADLRDFTNELRVENVTVTLPQLTADVSFTPFNLAHQGLDDRPFQEALFDAYGTLCPDLFFISPHLVRRPSEPSPALGSPQRPLRIAFISSHFFDHSIGRTLAETIIFMNRHACHKSTESHLDHQYVCVDTTVFLIDQSLTRGGGPRTDVITSAFTTALGDRFVRLRDGVESIRTAVSAHALDVLIFADLGMDFASYAVAFSRLATLQAAWWGHPITSGMTTIDVFLGLDEGLSNSASEYSEQLVRMDLMNTIPLTPMSVPVGLPSKTFFGIPGQANFAVVLGRIFKLHPDFDDVILGALDAVPTAYVVLIHEAISALNELFWKRISAKAKAVWGPTGDGPCGRCDDVLGRIRFVPIELYGDVLLQARAVLDTFPYGGCVTSHDAMSNGVPTVTWPSKYIRGRFMLKMYKQMGHIELVTGSVAEYVNVTVKLLANESFHRSQSNKIMSSFHHKMHMNSAVALEWLQFLYRQTLYLSK